MKLFLLLFLLCSPGLCFQLNDIFKFVNDVFTQITNDVVRLVSPQAEVFVTNSSNIGAFSPLSVRTKSYESVSTDISEYYGREVKKVCSFFVITVQIEKITEHGTILLDEKTIEHVHSKDQLLVTLGPHLEYSDEIFGIDLVRNSSVSSCT